MRVQKIIKQDPLKRGIILIDIIGKHSGTHYFNNAILVALGNDFNIRILSNYNDNKTEKFFPNIFTGSIFYKMIKLFYSTIKIIIFFLSNKQNVFIYTFYGSNIDRLFTFIFLFFRIPLVLDLHDLFPLDSNGSKFVNYTTNVMLGKISSVITHSDKTKKYFLVNKFRCSNYYFPHPRYILNVTTDNSAIDNKIIESLPQNRYNILFFGHIRLSKGIDNLFQIFNNLRNEDLISKVNLIIAGNDTRETIKNNNLVLHEKISHSLILRNITDGELVYIFKKVDIIILPYKQISQSGVLEMAVKFKKTVILSKLEYFENFLIKYPSFGVFFDFERDENFDLFLEDTIKKLESNLFYNEEDLRKYNENYDAQNIRKVFENLKGNSG